MDNIKEQISRQIEYSFYNIDNQEQKDNLCKFVYKIYKNCSIFYITPSVIIATIRYMYINDKKIEKIINTPIQEVENQIIYLQAYYFMNKINNKHTLKKLYQNILNNIKEKEKNQNFIKKHNKNHKRRGLNGIIRKICKR